MPSHLGIGGAADARARGPGDQLRAEADPEERNLTIERSADERGLVREPGMLGVLVRVHRAAEDHDRVVALRRVGLRTAVDGDPALQHVAALPDEVLEQAPAAGRRGLVDDREDAHATSVAGCAVQNGVGGRSLPPVAADPPRRAGDREARVRQADAAHREGLGLSRRRADEPGRPCLTHPSRP